MNEILDIIGRINYSVCVLLEGNLEFLMRSCSVVTIHVVLLQFNVNVFVLQRLSDEVIPTDML